jgi:hypothetical protein
LAGHSPPVHHELYITKSTPSDLPVGNPEIRHLIGIYTLVAVNSRETCFATFKPMRRAQMKANSTYYDAALATKFLARRASGSKERTRWYTIHDQIVSLVIERAPEGTIHLNYQAIGNDPEVYVLVTFLATGRGNHAFHTPWRCLSEPARQLVVRSLGSPRAFRARLREDAPVRSAVPVPHFS